MNNEDAWQLMTMIAEHHNSGNFSAVVSEAHPRVADLINQHFSLILRAVTLTPEFVKTYRKFLLDFTYRCAQVELGWKEQIRLAMLDELINQMETT